MIPLLLTLIGCLIDSLVGGFTGTSIPLYTGITVGILYIVIDVFARGLDAAGEARRCRSGLSGLTV